MHIVDQRKPTPTVTNCHLSEQQWCDVTTIVMTDVHMLCGVVAGRYDTVSPYCRAQNAGRHSQS